MERFSKLGNILDNYSAFLFDCDGVIWRGGKRIPHTLELIDKLLAMGKKIFFVTNNSTYSRKQLVDKMTKFGGYSSDDYSNVYTASFIAAKFAKKHYPQTKKVYAYGATVLAEEFRAQGFETICSRDHNDQYSVSYHEVAKVPFDQDIDLVIFGYDDRFNFFKTTFASYCIQNGAHFLATNPDLCTASPIAQHLKVPGCGALLKTLEASSGKQAIVTGKPNTFCFMNIIEEHNLTTKDILFIGDNLKTDILFANKAQVDSFLVLTGVTRKETLDAQLAQEGAGVPTFISENLDFN